jgi:hypothetical protein
MPLPEFSTGQSIRVQVCLADFEDDSKSTKSRLEIMNLTVNIDKRIRNLFERIEKDILSTVCSQNMQISPYSPVHVPAGTP